MPKFKVKKVADRAEILREFEKLPPEAVVGPEVVAALYGVSRASVYRMVARGVLQRPGHAGRLARWRVGYLRGGLK